MICKLYLSTVVRNQRGSTKPKLYLWDNRQGWSKRLKKSCRKKNIPQDNENEKSDRILGTAGILISVFYKQFYVNTFYNLCEMGNHVEENVNDINKWYINIWDMIYKTHNFNKK